MTDHLNEWNKEINYSPNKKKKLKWNEKMYRAVWETGLKLKSLKFFRSPRMTLESARNYIENKKRKSLRERKFWIETKESGKWEKFEDC